MDCRNRVKFSRESLLNIINDGLPNSIQRAAESDLLPDSLRKQIVIDIIRRAITTMQGYSDSQPWENWAAKCLKDDSNIENLSAEMAHGILNTTRNAVARNIISAAQALSSGFSDAIDDALGLAFIAAEKSALLAESRAQRKFLTTLIENFTLEDFSVKHTT